MIPGQPGGAMPPKPPQGRGMALDMLETEHGIDPEMRNPMSGVKEGEVFVDRSMLPNAKEGQEVSGRFTVGKIGTKVCLRPIEFAADEAQEAGVEGVLTPAENETGTDY